MTKLTKRFIEKLETQDRDYCVWDTELVGFGVRVMPSGRKSYLIQYRAGGRSRRRTIGQHGALTADQARIEARKLLGNVARGANPAEERARELRQPTKGCIHHTDRGNQYCSHDYQKLLRQHGFKVSMSGKGNCYDNSAVETFFKTNKAELIWRQSWPTRRAAELVIFNYINSFYNPHRRYSALSWKSPVAFERKVA